MENCTVESESGCARRSGGAPIYPPIFLSLETFRIIIISTQPNFPLNRTKNPLLRSTFNYVSP